MVHVRVVHEDLRRLCGHSVSVLSTDAEVLDCSSSFWHPGHARRAPSRQFNDNSRFRGTLSHERGEVY